MLRAMRTVIILMLVLLFTGCPGFAGKKETVDNASELTVGVVQKSIRIGMSQDEIALAMGSPNIVTRDSNGKEAWIYDKISTISSYSSTGFDMFLGGGGGGGGIGNSGAGGGGGLLGMKFGKKKENYTTTQKTLTVVIKFNDKSLVESFAYHSSKF